VLDIGCGAGRHALYLQRRGLRVTGIDASAQLVELAQRRGVKDVRRVDACSQLVFRAREFDTVILFGNNLGICGTLPKLRRMLRELYHITSAHGCILATSKMPGTIIARDREYIQQNIRRGRAVGQLRLRLLYNGKRGVWFDFLLLAPTDLIEIALKENWEVKQVFVETSVEVGYSVVLEKL